MPTMAPRAASMGARAAPIATRAGHEDLRACDLLARVNRGVREVLLLRACSSQSVGGGQVSMTGGALIDRVRDAPAAAVGFDSASSWRDHYVFGRWAISRPRSRYRVFFVMATPRSGSKRSGWQPVACMSSSTRRYVPVFSQLAGEQRPRDRRASGAGWTRPSYYDGIEIPGRHERLRILDEAGGHGAALAGGSFISRRGT